MRTSFVLHLDSLDVLDELSNEDAGVLLKAMRDFNRDEDPKLSGLMKVIFLPFKNQFIRDEVKYDEKSDKRSEAGRKGNLKRYNPDLYTQVVDKQITLEEAEIVAKGRNCEVSDTLPSQMVAKPRYKDSDSDSEKKKEKESTKGDPFNFLNSILALGVDKQIAKDWMSVRTKKKAANTLTAFNKIVSEINKSNLTANEIIKLCAEKSWVGFNPDWIKTETTKTTRSSDNKAWNEWEIL
jgi:hypothetical protein